MERVKSRGRRTIKVDNFHKRTNKEGEDEEEALVAVVKEELLSQFRS